MTPRTWAAYKVEDLEFTVTRHGADVMVCESEDVRKALTQEHRRAVRIVKAEIKRVKKDQHVFTAQTKGYLLEMLNSVLAALKRGRK